VDDIVGLFIFMTDTPRTDAAYKKYQGLVRAHIATGPLLETSRELERENARLREEKRITASQLEWALTQCYVVPPSAIEYPEGYDGYATKDSIAKAADMLSNVRHHLQPESEAKGC
jgi:hypothetical protein